MGPHEESQLTNVFVYDSPPCGEPSPWTRNRIPALLLCPLMSTHSTLQRMALAVHETLGDTPGPSVCSVHASSTTETRPRAGPKGWVGEHGALGDFWKDPIWPCTALSTW